MSLTEPQTGLKEAATEQTADTMGSPSVSTHRGLLHWQGILLVVSILTCLCPLASAQFALVPANVAKGENVSLYLHNTPPNVTSFVWYREKAANLYNKIATFEVNQNTYVKGPAYTGREEITHDGSLLLTNVTLNDTGNYTVEVYLRGSKKEVRLGQLYVYELVEKPILLVDERTITDDNNAVALICHTNAPSVQWLFNGTDLQPSKIRKLSENNRSLTIDTLQKENIGYYECKASNYFSHAHSWPVILSKKLD